MALAKETKKGDRLVPPGSLNRSRLSQTGVLAVSHPWHNSHTHTKNLLSNVPAQDPAGDNLVSNKSSCTCNVHQRIELGAD